MWRIYSSDKRSVRIKVRLRTLVETIAHDAIGIILVGKVRYLHTEGLLNWAKRVLRDADVPDVRLLGRTLLVKHMAFAHEQEVRLLYFEPREQQPKLFHYRIAPHAFVEEIVVDPRLSGDQATEFIDEIRIRTGFRGPIIHSDLYAPPRGFVLRLGKAFARFHGYPKGSLTRGICGRQPALPPSLTRKSCYRFGTYDSPIDEALVTENKTLRRAAGKSKQRAEFIINLKAAKQIGLTIPPNVLARANRVIR